MATVATWTIAFAFTGEAERAFQIGAVDFVIKLSLYFLNDRIWNRIGWGRQSGRVVTETYELNN